MLFDLSSKTLTLSINNKQLIRIQYDFDNVLPVFYLNRKDDELEIIDTQFI